MYSALDLFCGAGGFSLGLMQAGIQCVEAIEKDRFAIETHKSKFRNVPAYMEDICEFEEDRIKSLFSGIDILVGGPPCQGFSVSGPAQYGKIDSRNNLLLQMVRFSKILKPKICVLENVKGLLSGKLSKETKALTTYMSLMEGLGYTVSYDVLQAADFGVPQWRERVFVFASLKGKQFPKIKRTHDKSNWVPLKDAILDLPQIDSGEGVDKVVNYTHKAFSKYQLDMRHNSKGVANHVAMKHTPRLIERFREIPIGGSLLDVSKEHGQRLRNGQQLDAKPRYKSNNQRLDPYRISLAITASFQSNFVHPYKNRNLTAREGARIQSFPDDFIFKGPRTLMSKSLLISECRYDEIGLSQYNQIGNAVPPRIARAIAMQIKHYLKK